MTYTIYAVRPQAEPRVGVEPCVGAPIAPSHFSDLAGLRIQSLVRQYGSTTGISFVRDEAGRILSVQRKGSELPVLIPIHEAMRELERVQHAVKTAEYRQRITDG